jgi:hypothetical protein
MLPAALLIVLTVAGISLAATGALRLYRVLGVKRWPRTTAVILEQSIGCEPVVIEQAHPSYYPVIRFRYESAHGARESDKFSIVPKDYRSFDRRVVEQELKQFPLGATVTALICPSNPSMAVLRAVSTRTTSHYMALLLGGTLVLLACALLAPHVVP